MEPPPKEYPPSTKLPLPPCAKRRISGKEAMGARRVMATLVNQIFSGEVGAPKDEPQPQVQGLDCREPSVAPLVVKKKIAFRWRWGRVTRHLVGAVVWFPHPIKSLSPQHPGISRPKDARHPG